MNSHEQRSACCVYDFTLPKEANEGNYARWDKCTTNPMHDWITEKLRDIAKKWCFQLERGEETGLIHYQGRFSLKVKARINGVIGLFRERELNGYISLTSTENHQNMFYVMKPETRIDGPWKDTDKILNIPRHLRDTPNWYPFQQSIIDWIDIYDDRSVDVIIDPVGGQGKTKLCSWLGVRELARRVPVQKDARDISRMVQNCPKVKMYFIDLPRSNENKNNRMMYQAIEELKNGYCYDERYNYKEEYFDPPRVVVFTNSVPDLSLLSRDRWRLWSINQKRELVEFQPGLEGPRLYQPRTGQLTLTVRDENNDYLARLPPFPNNYYNK